MLLRFLRRTLVVAIAVLATLLAGEAYVRHLPNEVRDKHRWMTLHSDSVETLILGSSHTYYGIDPSLMQSRAYSLALTSQTYRYDLYLLRHYPLPRLHTVVLPFSYFSLYEDFETVVDPYLAARYRIYMDCDIHPWLSPLHLECLQGAAFRERLRSLWTPQRNSWSELGQGRNYTLESRPADWDNGAARAEANTRFTGDALGELPPAVRLNAAFLRDIMAYCRERGVRLVLLTTPTMPSFRRGGSQAQRDLNDRVLREVLRDYPETQRIDLEADERFGPDDFYDSDHLNTRGAARLTRLLGL